MSSPLVQDAFSTMKDGNKEWPGHVQLFQPISDQLVLPQLAKCYSIQAVLGFKKLKYDIVYRVNSEFMSPSGNVPFLRVDEEVVGEESILKYLKRKGFLEAKDLGTEEKIRITALLSLVERVLVPAERHCSWIIPENHAKSCQLYGSVFAFPLNKLLCRKERQETKEFLNALEWDSENLSEARDKVKELFEALSFRLEHSQFLVTNRPTEADAVICGHLRAIIEAELPNNYLREILQSFPKVFNFLRVCLKLVS